ncbi:MAG: hypothetical protein M3252_00120 [Actinomycetota bacterium]|nr:hypothetical protein [Actinomycetota bacterium]
MRLLLPLALTAGLLGGCSQAAPSQLRDDLLAQANVQADLHRRLDEFEARLADVELSTSAQAGVPGRLDVAEQRLSDVDRLLGDLAARLEEEDEAQEAAMAELRGAVSELRKTIQELNPKISGLQRSVGDLTSRLNLLEQRFANHARHPPG